MEALYIACTGILFMVRTFLVTFLQCLWKYLSIKVLFDERKVAGLTHLTVDP